MKNTAIKSSVVILPLVKALTYQL